LLRGSQPTARAAPWRRRRSFRKKLKKYGETRRGVADEDVAQERAVTAAARVQRNEARLASMAARAEAAKSRREAAAAAAAGPPPTADELAQQSPLWRDV